LSPSDDFDNLDHSVITGTISAAHYKHEPFRRTVRHFSEEKLRLLNNNLGAVPWHTSLCTDHSVHDCINTFYSILNEELDLAIPLVSFTTKPGDKPGMTKEVSNKFRQTHRLHRLARRTANAQDFIKMHIDLRKKTGVKLERHTMNKCIVKVRQ